jgi:sulfur carrier protein
MVGFLGAPEYTHRPSRVPVIRGSHEAQQADVPGGVVKVVLRNPRREVEVRGGRRIRDVLGELQILPETVLVIRGDALATADEVVGDDETIELRPVMSGGVA